MKKIISILALASTTAFGEATETIIELRAHVANRDYLIVEVDNIDFGQNLFTGSQIEKGSEIRVHGKKDIDVRVSMDKNIDLASTQNGNDTKLFSELLNHGTVTGQSFKLNERIEGASGNTTIPLNFKLTVPEETSGDYFGSSVIRVTVDN